MIGDLSRAVVPLFGVSIFGSAALLFAVQPMVARMLLPRLGGSPAVWTTCVLFFQSTLLLGYIYAHIAVRRLTPRRQVLFHLAILSGALLVLPITVAAGAPPGSGTPVWWLLTALVISVGPPFVVLASTTPLLQGWLSLLRGPSARDPYFLYSASSAGSLTGLLIYPFLVEPALRLADQSRVWAAAYCAVGLLIGCCGTLLLQFRSGEMPALAHDDDGADAHRGQGGRGWRERLLWLALSFAPASLMLGVTQHISMEIAAIPLLWVIPLALYLLTFSLTFARRPPIPRRWMTRLLPVSIAAAIAALIVRGDQRTLVAVHLATFFLAAMVCHRELAERRPAVRDLTAFYLWMATGGALGGLFNTLVAPAVFTTVVEYPLVLGLVALLRPSPGWGWWGREPDAIVFGVPLVAGGMGLVAWNAGLISGGLPAVATTYLMALLGGLAFANRVRPFAVTIALILVLDTAIMPLTGRNRVVHAARSFFGVHRVVQNTPPTAHFLWHGNTLHGQQQLGERDACVPTTYYDSSGPIGQLFAALDGRAHRVAIIGLGSGSLACYARPGDHWTFYEIDPEIERIAKDGRYFTFLENSPGRIDVVLGDGRLALANAPPAAFHAIVVDAYGSDAIPVHLLTEEFVELMLSRLLPDGVVAFHVTSRHLDLEPVLAAVAARLRLEAHIQRDELATLAQRRAGKARSDWIVMAREAAALGPIVSDPRWRPARPGASSWTDDFSNVLDALKWR
jgi:hypothetical protein